MQVVYDFCESADDQAVLQRALPFFKEIPFIELVCYYPDTKQFMTYQTAPISTRYWDQQQWGLE
jgi:hypothetical protein